jgi:hypothetical protein
MENWFSKKAVNIKNDMLRPAEKRTVSIMFFSCNLRSLSSKYPGTNERKQNPKICLASGISRKIEIHVAMQKSVTACN